MSLEHFKDLMEIYFMCFVILNILSIGSHVRAIHAHLEEEETEPE